MSVHTVSTVANEMLLDAYEATLCGPVEMEFLDPVAGILVGGQIVEPEVFVSSGEGEVRSGAEGGPGDERFGDAYLLLSAEYAITAVMICR